MAPKHRNPKDSSDTKGRTRKQREEDELADIQKLAVQVYNEVRKASTKHGADDGAAVAAAQERRMPTAEEMQRYLMQRQAMEMEAIAAAQVYVNTFMPLDEEHKRWQRLGSSNKWLRLEQFRDERMDDVVALFSAELSEPYSAFTYEHFLGGWPDLGILAFGVESATEPTADTIGAMVGCVVSKVSRKRPPTCILRGYIAMLAVSKSFRGHKIGQRLVRVTVELMRKKECDEVGLETPTTNERALNLYLDLGFAKTKYLAKYYLDGSDAVRLKLWTHDAVAKNFAASK